MTELALIYFRSINALNLKSALKMCFTMQIKLPSNFQESQFAVTGIKKAFSQVSFRCSDFAARE